jgi:dienelactone hydrolase
MTPQVLTPYVLSTLAAAQAEGKISTLDTLVEAIKVRRADLRRTVSALHREGMLDVRTMRLTMMGFALGAMYKAQQLPPLRRPRLVAVAAA